MLTQIEIMERKGYGYEINKPIVLDKFSQVEEFLSNLCMEDMPSSKCVLNRFETVGRFYMGKKNVGKDKKLTYDRFVSKIDVYFNVYMGSHDVRIVKFSIFLEVLESYEVVIGETYIDEDKYYEELNKRLAVYSEKTPEGLRMRFIQISKPKRYGTANNGVQQQEQ
jgi:hypothetical protein